MTRGIYQIRNIVTGENYIGAARDIALRLEAHRQALTKGKHINKRLQDAWDSAGAAAFAFEVVEDNVPMEMLNAREKHHIAEKLTLRGSLEYNRTRGGEGIPPEGLSPMQQSHRRYLLEQEARVRAVQIQRGEARAMTDEELAVATTRMMQLREDANLRNYEAIRMQQVVDVPLLIAEVERLRDLARSVADMPLAYSHEAGNYCVFCDATDHDTQDGVVQHTADCPVTKARAVIDIGPLADAESD